MNRVSCACGREQTIVGARDLVIGITAEEAVALGWVRTTSLSGNVMWTCPFCAGNTGVIRRVFEKTS